ncbi:MAG: hypothetical protein WD468_09575 [Pirellulales bacterium]
MNRPRLLRGLRVAWTAVFGILCVLLVLLWVRSYWAHDVLRGWVPIAGLLQYESTCNVVTLNITPSLHQSKWTWHAKVPEVHDYHWWFRHYANPPNQIPWYFIAAPHWFLVLITGLMAAATGFRLPLRLSYSLRTLLIITTLVAVVLGVAVWSSG